MVVESEGYTRGFNDASKEHIDRVTKMCNTNKKVPDSKLPIFLVMSFIVITTMGIVMLLLNHYRG